jgi:hypothetical protein
MPILRAPAFWPNLAATVSLFRHTRAGLAEPAALPRIERTLRAATLDPAWLRSYHECIGLGSTAGDTLAPLTLQIAAAPLHLAVLADGRFPFRALGLVHMSQSVLQTRPLPANAAFDLLVYSTEARWEKRGMSFCLVTEARCDGDLVWQGRTRALAPGPSPGAQAPAGGDHAAPDLGLPRCTQALHVPESCGRRYAAIAGDLNPIHQHALLARPFGFKRAIVHGTWTLARALVLAGLPRSAAFSLNARFRRPVSLPSDVLVRAWDAQPAQPQTVLVSSADGDTTYLSIDVTESVGAPVNAGT